MTDKFLSKDLNFVIKFNCQMLFRNDAFKCGVISLLFVQVTGFIEKSPCDINCHLILFFRLDIGVGVTLILLMLLSVRIQKSWYANANLDNEISNFVIILKLMNHVRINLSYKNNSFTLWYIHSRPFVRRYL